MGEKLFFILISLLFSTQTYAMDATVTTIDGENTHVLKNIRVLCEGKYLGEDIIIIQDGAQVEIPLTSISMMRTLQMPNGFYLKTLSGTELTGCRMSCPSYMLVGENDFGGKTSIDGKKWKLIKF